jgi:hypothetical protein
MVNLGEINLDAVGSSLAVLDSDLSACQCLLLTGSHSEGLASGTSDLDLIVITNRESTWGRDESCRTGFVNGTRVECLVLAPAGLEKLIAVAQAEDYNRFTLRQLEILHKLLFGRVLFGKHEALEQTLSSHRKRFCSQMADFYFKAAENIYEDIVGAQPIGGLTLSLRWRDLGLMAIDADLCRSGDTYPKPKWRPRRVERTFGEGSSIWRFLQLLECGTPSHEDAIQVWAECISRSVAQIQLHHYFNIEETSLESPAERHYALKGYIFRFKDSFYIRDALGTAKIAPTVALCALLSGAGYSIERCERMFGSHLGLGDRSNRAYAACLRAALARGLLVSQT